MWWGWAKPVGNDDLTAFFTAFNYSPEMAALYAELLEGWRAAGGTLFNAFVDVGAASRWGSWGALRHLDDSNPRWATLMTYNAAAGGWEDRAESTFAHGVLRRGGQGGETLTGTAGPDILIAGGGDDRLHLGPGDRAHGGAGLDIAVLEGRAADYALLDAEDGISRLNGPGGPIWLVDVERAEFADEPGVQYAITSGGSSMAARRALPPDRPDQHLCAAARMKPLDDAPPPCLRQAPGASGIIGKPRDGFCQGLRGFWGDEQAVHPSRISSATPPVRVPMVGMAQLIASISATPMARANSPARRHARADLVAHAVCVNGAQQVHMILQPKLSDPRLKHAAVSAAARVILARDAQREPLVRSRAGAAPSIRSWCPLTMLSRPQQNSRSIPRPRPRAGRVHRGAARRYRRPSAG